MSEPELFIGIPAYKESKSLDETIRFIRERSHVPHRFEAHVAKQSVVKNKNALLRMAKSSGAKYVCFCDDDIEPEPGWDACLLESLQQYQSRTRVSIGQTSPRILYPDGRLFCAWVNVYFDPEKKEHRLSNPGAADLDMEVFHSQVFVGALPGTCTVFSAEFLDRVDWQFDERYEKSQQEDVDQSLTCRSLGFALLFNGRTHVVHHVKQQTPRAGGVNLQRFYDKWAHRADLTFVLPPDARAIAAANNVENGFTRRRDLLGQGWKLLRDRPLHRLRMGLQVLAKNGPRGVLAHCRRIALASMVEKDKEEQ